MSIISIATDATAADVFCKRMVIAGIAISTKRVKNGCKKH